MADHHITEIIPELDKAPEWVQEAFRDGRFFVVALERILEMEATITALEAKLKAIGELADGWGIWAGKATTNHAKKCAEPVKVCADELQAILEQDDG